MAGVNTHKVGVKETQQNESLQKEKKLKEDADRFIEELDQLLDEAESQ